jgi:Domain of unknown function (DUF222)
MSAGVAVVDRQDRSADPLCARLDAMLSELANAVAVCAELRDVGEVSDAERIDRIARLERLKAAAAGLQAAESVRFAQSQVAQQIAADVHPKAIGRGIADQLALACKVSPTEGSRRLRMARALWFDLPGTFRLLTGGQLSEYVASLVVSETRHLDARTRREVDAKIVTTGIAGMGPRRAAAYARRHAYQADPHGYLERGRTERKHRRVGLRPAPDTMAVMSGYLPVEQGVACLAALRRHTDAAKADGDQRTRDQIMADTLVERLTGQAAAADVNVELQLLMPLDALLKPDSSTAAEMAGHGPVPAGIARHILHTSRGRRCWRRLFTAPAGGPIVGGDRCRRRFDGLLATLITLRDQACRDPYCDAPIRHLDHVHRRVDGGSTTMANGRGLCERGNYIREMPGWLATVIDDGRHYRPHTVVITTPTGHSYTSSAPQPP